MVAIYTPDGMPPHLSNLSCNLLIEYTSGFKPQLPLPSSINHYSSVLYNDTIIIVVLVVIRYGKHGGHDFSKTT